LNLKKILVGAVAMFSIYSPIANAEVVVVQGSGSIESAAIQDAKRQAVEEVVGVILKSESNMVNFNLVYDAINVRAQGYVKSFKIISKKKSGKMIDITAQVDVSSEPGSELMKDMEVIMSLNDPRLAVVTEYYGDDGGENFKRYAEMCSSAIRQELIKRGFTHVVDKPLNVDYIIVGKLTVGKGKAITLPNFNDLSKPQMTQIETGLTKNEAIIDCKIKKADTDEFIGEFHSNGSNIGSSSNGSLDNQAVVQLAGKAAQEVRTIFNLEASKVFKSVKIVAQSSDGGKLMQLENYLRQVQGVTGVYVRSMSNGKCIIDVSTGLSPQNLHRSLSAVVKNKFPIRLQSFSGTVLEVVL
jgi:hypothetical protein